MSEGLLPRLAWWTAVAALTELLLLRLATRTFVHIPGLDLATGPLTVVAETGRLAFYLALVLLVVVLGMVVSSVGRTPTPRLVVGAAAMVVVAALVSGAGDAPVASGWLSVGAVGLAALAALGLGWRALPLLLWAIAVGLNASATLFQGPGGGLEGEQVGRLLLAADALGVTAAAALPLISRSRPTRTSLVAGLVAGVATTGALWAASATTTILVLWAFGIPAGLSPLLYGIGAGAVVTTVGTALGGRRRLAAAGVVLLAAGGFGLISTYQTGLVVAGLVLVVLDLRPVPHTDVKETGGGLVGAPTAPDGRVSPLPAHH